MNDAKTLLGQQILKQKDLKKLTWAQIAGAIGQAPVWTCAACLGQMSVPTDIAQKIVDFLGLPAEAVDTLATIPYRGSLPTAIPTDPLIYRFYELINVYGTTWKEIIQEEFGDGIMSAIDFDMAIERQPDPKGDRVKMTLSGKFLPYKRY